MFDNFCLFVVSNFDEIRQILSLLQNMGGVLHSGRFLLLQFLNEFLELFLLYSHEFFLVLFEFLDEGLDLQVPPALELLDLSFAFLADDLDLNSEVATCYFSRMAMVSFR
jgi:hypothetical protein